VNRTEKAAHVESMVEVFRKNPHLVLTDFKGLTSNQSNELRRRVRAAGGTFHVLKNRLARRAAEGTAVDKIQARLVGTCGLAGHPNDPVAIAKVVTDFVKDNPQLKLVAAVIDSRDVLDGDAGVKALSTMPGLPELRAQLLALINTPATMLVRLLNTPAGQVARAIDARREKLEGEAN
jgi:large subunit ribosomal protein L10